MTGKKNLFIVTGGALLLAACNHAGPTSTYMDSVDVDLPPPPSCNASTLQWMVGQPESAVTGIAFENPVRVVHAGEVVTQEYIANRTTFLIDDTGVVSTVSCG